MAARGCISTSLVPLTLHEAELCDGGDAEGGSDGGGVAMQGLHAAGLSVPPALRCCGGSASGMAATAQEGCRAAAAGPPSTGTGTAAVAAVAANCGATATNGDRADLIAAWRRCDGHDDAGPVCAGVGLGEASFSRVAALSSAKSISRLVGRCCRRNGTATPQPALSFLTTGGSDAFGGSCGDELRRGGGAGGVKPRGSWPASRLSTASTSRPSSRLSSGSSDVRRPRQ